MNVLIVEDEMMAQANLARALTQHFPDVRIVGTTGSVRETVLWLRTPGNSADVIFMDVELSDGDCFEIFRQADVTARVIMTTAYDNYAVRAFEVNSIDYLLKPIDPAALRRAVERCRVRSGGIDPDVLLNAIRGPREYKQRYVVRFNDRIVPVQIADIAYFYSEEKNTYLVTNDNNRYIVDQSLDVLSDELDPGRFFRISRGCIIAMPAIVSIVKYLGNRLKITARPRSEFEMVVSPVAGRRLPEVVGGEWLSLGRDGMIKGYPAQRSTPFLWPGATVPQYARQRRPLQAIMSCSDSLKVSLCSSSSSGRCIR